MSRALSILLVGLITASPVLADWDPVLEAKEATQRESARKADQAQRAKSEQMKRDAQSNAFAEMTSEKRKQLGAAAQGKSDAEVNKMYEARTQQATKDAYAAMAGAQQKMAQAPKNMDKVDMNELDANTKAATGKSFADLSNMSDKDLDALAAEMERKYGK